MIDQEEDESEKNKKKEGEQEKAQHENFPGEKLSNPERTPEQQEEVDFLSGLLFEQTEELTEKKKKRKRKREKEIEDNQIIELQDGRRFKLKELVELVVGKREPYEALFPNKNDFFSEVFRLNGIERDPKKYPKPYAVSQIIRRIIYGRFEKEVLPALDHLNPIIAGGFRGYKLSQYLNAEGKKKVIQVRDEAVEMMRTFPDSDWYRFEKAYAKKYSLSFQRSLFDKED